MRIATYTRISTDEAEVPRPLVVHRHESRLGPSLFGVQQSGVRGSGNQYSPNQTTPECSPGSRRSPSRAGVPSGPRQRSPLTVTGGYS